MGRKQLRTPEASARHARLLEAARGHLHTVGELAKAEDHAGVRRQLVTAARDAHLADAAIGDDEDEQVLRDAWHFVQSAVVRGDFDVERWAARFDAGLADLVHLQGERAKLNGVNGAAGHVWKLAPDACARCRESHLLTNGQARVRTGRPQLAHPGCSCELQAATATGDTGGAGPVLDRYDADLVELLRVRYQAGAAQIAGFPIVIENPVGSSRSWRGGVTRMTAPYGYIAGARGSDGEDLDCYLGTDPLAPMVYVVHQAAPDGAYDEDKAILFAGDAETARAIYLAHRDDGEAAIYGFSQVTVDEFKQKIQEPLFDGFLKSLRAARDALTTLVKAEPARVDPSNLGNSLDPRADIAHIQARGGPSAHDTGRLSPATMLDLGALVAATPGAKDAADARREWWRHAIDPSPVAPATAVEPHRIELIDDAAAAFDELERHMAEQRAWIEARVAEKPEHASIQPMWSPAPIPAVPTPST